MKKGVMNVMNSLDQPFWLFFKSEIYWLPTMVVSFSLRGTSGPGRSSLTGPSLGRLVETVSTVETFGNSFPLSRCPSQVPLWQCMSNQLGSPSRRRRLPGSPQSQPEAQSRCALL